MRPCRGKCRGLLPHITDFLEGVAGKSICERIRRHMVGCEKCRMYVDTQTRLIGLYKEWRDEKLPAAVQIRLRKRLDALMADDPCETKGNCRRRASRARKPAQRPRPRR